MQTCPNCGAGMRFDIATQKLLCDFCSTSMDVPEEDFGLQAKEDTMDMTAFTCPQCGGEILSMSNEAASFCSFCGASVMLEGRLTSAKRPAHIIPFQKTKEDCKKIYGDFTRKAWFSPKALKDPEYLERFRAIYLPFWNYDITQKGPVLLKGTRERSNATEYLNLTCELDAEFDGISYDASSAFDDELCRYITPFHESALKPFNPGYMSGFYADTADVDGSLYIADAQRDANNETFDRLRGQYPGVSVTKPKDMDLVFHTQTNAVSMAMYPVWFLTYRSGDRVAYAVVNGETGKIAADMPVDNKKFLLGSLILTVPIFLLLTLLPVITARAMMASAVLLAVLSVVIFVLSSMELKGREERSSDKGYQSTHGKDVKVQAKGTRSQENKFLSFLRTVLPGLGALAGIAVLVLDPVSDVIYYAGAMIVLMCIIFTLTGLIGRFNLLATRPIPEFHERGGARNG